jgi:F-type H+-transporting ATPase subunit b
MRNLIGSRRNLLLTAALLLLCLLPCFAISQQKAGASAPPAKRAEAAPQRESIGAEVAEESREAAGEDDKFKKSTSVKLLARITHLSLEHAFWLGVIVNFAVVAALVFWFARKTLPAAFRNRTLSIQKAMAEARQASEEANRRLADIESRLSRLDSEIAELRAAADREAAEEDERMRIAAEEDAFKIRQAAEQEIVAAAKAARRELTAYAADLAVALAAKQLHVDATTDRVLVRNFAQHLSSVSPKAEKDGK